MSDPAPDYEGLTPILIPCDGRKLLRADYPNFSASDGCTFYPNGTFCIPNKPPQIEEDVANYAKLVRTILVDLRTGTLHWKAEKIDYLDYFKP